MDVHGMLHKLVFDREWSAVMYHLQGLSDGDAVHQLFYVDKKEKFTALVQACWFSVPLELVQLVITKAKLDSRKRRLLAITDIDAWTALHYAACDHSGPAVVELSPAGAEHNLWRW